ncbi:unnamed protein product [Candida verbasci]|uniref:Oligopeptide transporter n=1 Tax=Candida verbasci TaxID=1227364 RepID=A0A9W4XJ10_9ASCO|nr:unnamed protein product [Candida verbasci]
MNQIQAVEEEEQNNRDSMMQFRKLNQPQVTIRSIIVGIFIGSIILISNFQFGLQTGWVSMMSLPAALLGFTIFKLSGFSSNFTDVENVFIQSLAVAVGTGPLCYGFIGIIPAIEKFLSADESGSGKLIHFNLNELMLWSLGLGLFGVFFAIPLRKQVVIKEKLPFPSGSATATLISVLHDEKLINLEITSESESEEEMEAEAQDNNYNSNIRSLLITFVISSSYTLISYFFPILKNIPIFGRVGSKWEWDFQPSPAYIGQGIIMGLPTVSYMLFGAILGWGILAPLSNYMKWAPGEISDWKTGSRGWILWISLSIMISDSLVSFVVISFKSVLQFLKDHQRLKDDYEIQSLLDKDDEKNEIPEKYLVSNTVTIIGIIISTIICIISLKIIFKSLVPVYAIFVAIVLAMLFSVLGVRALGETDLNPVSGIGKLSQLIFAVIIPNNHPSKILINLIAGGIAEAGAQQAGDLIQDLKTGHLIGASPKAQFIAQIIGTFYSIFLSSIMYKVYNSIYEIPGSLFRIPTAIIWIDCSRLVSGEGLPEKAGVCAIIFGLMFGVISLIKNIVPKKSKYYKWLIYLPNGVAVGIGIYNTPNFTIARFLGGLIAYNWRLFSDRGKISMIILSSGLVLGEGLFSSVTMLLTSLGVKQYQ